MRTSPALPAPRCGGRLGVDAWMRRAVRWQAACRTPPPARVPCRLPAPCLGRGCWPGGASMGWRPCSGWQWVETWSRSVTVHGCGRRRADWPRHAVAPVAPRCRCVFAAGPIEASSHVETTLTQLVQEVTVAAQVGELCAPGIAARQQCCRADAVRSCIWARAGGRPPQVLLRPAQVRRLERQRGLRLSTTELLANSLGKLAASVQQLSEGLAAAAAAAAGPTPATMLFAGRRSSSRRYLVLQNL